MKRNTLLLGAAVAACAYGSAANAVTIPVTVSGGIASGTINVGYTPGAGSIGAEIASNGSQYILFRAVSASGENYACGVAPADPLYGLAKDILYSLNAGSYLTIGKDGSKCTILQLKKNSEYL